MSIAIYVLEKSIADFAGSVVAVGPDGSGIYFDAPHMHATRNVDASSREQRRKRIFMLGARGSEVESEEFAQSLADIRKILKKLAVPIVSSQPVLNSDGISIGRYIVYETDKVDILIPKIFSGISMGSPDGARCEAHNHLAIKGLGYKFCPIDGTPLSEMVSAGIYETFFRERFRISEVRVEEPSARKACDQHEGERFPNLFSFCPICGGRLHVAKKHGAAPGGTTES